MGTLSCHRVHLDNTDHHIITPSNCDITILPFSTYSPMKLANEANKLQSQVCSSLRSIGLLPTALVVEFMTAKLAGNNTTTKRASANNVVTPSVTYIQARDAASPSIASIGDTQSTTPGLDTHNTTPPRVVTASQPVSESISNYLNQESQIYVTGPGKHLACYSTMLEQLSERLLNEIEPFVDFTIRCEDHNAFCPKCMSLQSFPGKDIQACKHSGMTLVHST